MSNSKFESLITEFANQAEHPPKNDPHIRACYTAVVKNSNQSILNDLLQETIDSRPDTSNQHLVNLFLRAIQYAELFWLDNKDRYPNHLDGPSSWVTEIDLILEKHSQEFRQLLATKDTGTTIYQRYTGPKAIISALHDNQPVSVGDFGCGGAFGIIGLKNRVPFSPVEDSTPNQLFTNLVSKSSTIERGVAIDKESPFTQSSRDWRLACSLYPCEFSRLEEFMEMEEKMRSLDQIDFLQADITQPISSKLNRSTLDVAILSTILYQMPEKQKTVIDRVKKYLRPTGTLIVNEFAEISANGNKSLEIHGVNWFKKDGGYRTFAANEKSKWNFLEVFRFSDGRCTQVSAGQDLEEFIQLSHH